MYIMWSWKC